MKLPFSVSGPAHLWIKDRLRLQENLAQLDGLEPVLCCSSGYRIRDVNYQIIEAYEAEFIDIGWDDPGNIAGQGLVQIELCERRVFLTRETLESLSGSLIVLRSVEVGIPDRASKTVELLFAIRKGLGQYP